MNTKTLADFAAAHVSMNELFRPENIPPLVLGAIERYVEQCIRPGDCTLAILSNDLFLAVARADEHTLRALPAIVAYVAMKVPEHARGSRDAVEMWLQRITDPRQLEAAR